MIITYSNMLTCFLQVPLLIQLTHNGSVKALVDHFFVTYSIQVLKKLQGPTINVVLFN